MAIDERLVGALHLQSLSAGDLEGERGHAHGTFQTSTIAALLDGAYDGDVTFAELAERGDFGLGTLDGCDGEMIALDGSFLRADVEGRLHPVPPEARTPFAVVTRFRPLHSLELAGPLSDEEVRAAIDAAVGQHLGGQVMALADRGGEDQDAGSVGHEGSLAICAAPRRRGYAVASPSASSGKANMTPR